MAILSPVKRSQDCSKTQAEKIIGMARGHLGSIGRFAPAQSVTHEVRVAIERRRAGGGATAYAGTLAPVSDGTRVTANQKIRLSQGEKVGDSAVGSNGGDEVKIRCTRPAKVLRGQGRFREAIELLERGLQEHPDNLRILCSMGEIYRQMRQYEKALEWFDRALAVDPRNEVAHNAKGQVYLAQGRYADALREFDRTLELNERNEVAHYSKAKLYYLKGEPGKARQHFGPLLERPDPRPSVLYLLAACTASEDSLWLTVKGAIGDQRANQIRRVAEVRDDLLRILEEEERNFFYWNSIWDGTGYRPVNRLALRQMGKR